MKPKLLKIFKWLFMAGAAVGVIVALFVFVYVIRVTKDLPSVEVLAEYKPAIMTRVHAGDGKLITEYAKEHRVFVPIESIPKEIQHAVVAAEDQRFYSHNGFDVKGFIRAMIANVGHVLRKERMEGGSTLTQQVAKNFLVGNERSVDRKIREIFIARRIEKAMDKDHIMELYLNEIYFGRRAYGIAAASLNYFGKSMDDLTLSEMAYLALLPKGPNNYRLDNPDKKKRAMARRNYVLGRMVDDGYIEQADADEAREQELELADRLSGEEYLAAEYFIEEARKQIFDIYGEDTLYEGGLSIRTTLDTSMQLAARKALRTGLEAYDRRHGYRGPLGTLSTKGDWEGALAAFDAPRDIGDWRVALVLKAEGNQAELGFVVPEPEPVTEVEGEIDGVEEQDVQEEEVLLNRGTIKVSDIKWAGKALPEGRYGAPPKVITDAINEGDVILVQVKKDSKTEYNLRQVPAINGGLIAMDPHTGRVLALVGGYSFEQSQFNRATQAYRQPGSSFKPFVYAAAMDNGFTPSSQVLDAPFVIKREDVDCSSSRLALRGGASKENCEQFYKPSNYDAGKFYGLSTLRLGLEKSRNAMTVRLANEIGMDVVGTYATEFGIYDEMPAEQLAYSLGAGETTLLRLANAYSMLVNGGKRVYPTIMDRVQDGAGNTIYVHDNQTCEECKVEEWTGAPPPDLPDNRAQVIDPVTAYQVTFMLKGVVDNGTGRSIAVLGRPLGGKTGTTNDFKDAWFMGFSPDLVAGVYVGMDTPTPLGGESGGRVAAPIFRDFMGEVLEGKPKVPFRIPEGVTLSPVNRDTGEPSYIGAPNFILEAFKPGTEPKLGELASTIRVGSGTNSYLSNGLFVEPGDFGDDEYVNDKASIEDEESEISTEADDVIGDGEDEATDTPSLSLPGSDPAAEERIEARVEKPKSKPQEDVLEDGLY